MLLASLNAQNLKSFFPSTYYDRGLDYYRQNRVHDLEIACHKKGDEIFARVRGGKNADYEVIVRISGAVNKLYIRGVCSCPMQINCKHVVAALLKAIHQISSSEHILPAHHQQKDSIKNLLTNLQMDDDNVQTSERNKLSDPKVDLWLNTLDNVLTQKNKAAHIVDETYSLHYLFNTPHQHSNELHLTLTLVRRLKSGKFGTPKKFSETALSHQKHLLPVDKELLIKLEVAKKFNSGSYSSSYPMRGSAFEKLLPELIATGRCHWLNPDNVPMTLAKTETAELRWCIDDNGFQELRPSLFSNTTESFISFSIDKLWYLNKTTGELGLLETGLEDKVAAVLLSAPKIPPGSAREVAKVLKQDVRLSTVAQPKVFTETKIATQKPIFCLRLTQAYVAMRGDYTDHYQLIKLIKPIAMLTFNYQGVEVTPEDNRAVIHQVDHEQFIQISRDKKMEKQAVIELIIHGAIPIHEIPEIYRISTNSTLFHHYLIGYMQNDPLDFSIRSLPLLRARGWQIQIDTDYPYQIVDDAIDDWYSSIEESSRHDWFNLELGITLKGEKINLLPVLQQLLLKLRLNNNSLDASCNEPVLAKLPDGRYISLPMDRVRNILNVLVELYDSESLTDGDFLQLSKLHAARLLELEAAMGATKLRWHGGERLRALAEKLVQFTGIQSVSIPKEFQGQLRPYQQDGLNWLQFLREYEFGGILADDMGLGKTVQALSHLTVEKVNGRMKKPTLIIAPTSLMFNWRMEAERFSPHLKVLVLHGSDRKQQFENISQYDLVFTTYPLLKHDKDILLKQSFHYLILDEAQCIKNSKSLSANIAQQIQADYRLCLTGTPLENHLGELWSLFHFMMPGLLGDEKSFNRLFRTPIEKHGNLERRNHLIHRISPFLLRRTKNNVVKELPDKVNMIRQVEIDGAQRDLYETIRVTMQKKVRQEIAKLGLARSHIIILDALLKLRQVCCDPRLLKIDTAKKNKAKSAKLELLMTLLPEMIEEGRRILLFSQFTEMLELIETELIKQELPYVKLTGQTKDRQTPIQQFQNGEIPLFLISLKAGGTGLNLTAADTVIHYDPWWNPAVEDQATDRAHRIGQDKTVFVYKFVTKGTVEEKILEMQQNKRALMEGLFSGNTTGKLKLTEKDLQGFFEPLDDVE